MQILKSFLEGLKPVETLTVSQWADKNRFLTTASSAEPGRFKTSRTPYIREIADHLGKTSDVWRISVKKAAQLAFTECGNNWTAYVMDINPGGFLMVMPTEETVKRNSRIRITPMINGSPTLRDKIKKAGAKESNNTITHKEFPGGFLMMIGANAPTGLRSTPAGNIFLDECDAYPASSGEEGNPIDLAEARSNTFSNKKLFIISTPTIEGTSIIEAEFLEGDQRYYNVPCQGCEVLFVMRFEHLTFDENDPSNTRLACPNCGFLHEERHKTLMLMEEGYGGRAKWIPTASPSDKLIRSYQISGLYSPAGWLSWEQIARKFLKIKGDTNKEITFVNTVLGETYKIKGDVPDYDNLYNRREDYQIGTVPDPVYFLTMGVDVQPDRLECEVVGWCKGRSTYSIEYLVFSGDTSKDEVWDQLSVAIGKQYPVSDNSLMPITLTCVDSGYNTKKVYDFCNKFEKNRVVPVKGASTNKTTMVTQPKQVNVTKSGKKIGSSKVWMLGVSLLKSELYGFLKLKAREENGVTIYPEGYCHFPNYGMDYFLMLTAEQLQMIKNKKTGAVTYEWVKVRDRNEALDVRNYARAAAYILGIDRFSEKSWDAMRKITKIEISKEKEKPASKPVKKKSSFWDKK